MPRPLALAALAVAVAAGPTAAAPPLSPADAVRLRQVVKPQPHEDVYDTVPWLTSLWDARQKAAAAGKPILLWEMDGHPLGCG